MKNYFIRLLSQLVQNFEQLKSDVFTWIWKSRSQKLLFTFPVISMCFLALGKSPEDAIIETMIIYIAILIES